MTAKRFYMDKSGDLYDKENGLLMLDFGYSYDGVNCKRIIDLLNEQHETIERLKQNINEISVNVEKDLLKENEQLKQELQNLRAEKTYETITLREQVPNETIEKFKKDLKDGKFIELTARLQVRKHKNDHISWKGDVE